MTWSFPSESERWETLAWLQAWPVTAFLAGLIRFQSTPPRRQVSTTGESSTSTERSECVFTRLANSRSSRRLATTSMPSPPVIARSRIYRDPLAGRGVPECHPGKTKSSACRYRGRSSQPAPTIDCFVHRVHFGERWVLAHRFPHFGERWVLAHRFPCCWQANVAKNRWANTHRSL